MAKRVWWADDEPYNSTDGLMDLIKLFPEDTVMAEVGCLAGISTKVFAGACKKVYAIDSWKPYSEVNSERMSEAIGRFDENLKGCSNVEVIKMHSLDAVNDFKDEGLDVVYIDANHSYAAFRKDLRAWIPKVKRGGIIAGHDYHHLDIHIAMRELLGKPYMLFSDLSWCKFKE
jgi:predicted O-methyltransferase YrrM